MHVQHSGKALFPFIILVLICITGYLYLPMTQGKPTFPRNSVTKVTATKATEQSRIISVSAVGNARANQAIDIVSSKSDYIHAIYFNDGDYVKQNSKLIQLLDTEEQLAVQELTIKLTEQQRQQARLTELANTQSAARSALEEQRSITDALATQLKSAQVALDEMTITAPFDGLLGKKQISKGSFVDNKVRITTLDDISTIKVDFQIPEKYFGQLHKNMVVTASSDAYGQTRFTGYVSHIDPRINESTRSVQVTAKFANKNAKLRPGMLLQVKLELRAITAIMLPEKSIIPRKDQHYVYIVDEQGKALLTPVTVQARFNGWVAISSGVADGQQIVTEGTTKIRSGSSVVIKG